MIFLRSFHGTDRNTALWMLDTGSGQERLIADPAALHDEKEVSPEEQARRERARERATGITGYATDREVRRVVFGLSGKLFLAELVRDTEQQTAIPEEYRSGAAVRALPTQQPAAEPRLSPDGHTVTYLANGALRVIATDGSDDRALVEPEHDGWSWGAAEFIAAEEMNRHRGYWWAPDSTRILAAGVDESPVNTWHLADPADPTRPPTTMRYPAAGTHNAEVRLAVLDLHGERIDVEWDRQAHPYLVAAHWSRHGRPLLAVQSRDQRTQLVLEVDPETGTTQEIHRDTDPHWVEITSGWPAWSPKGELVRIRAQDGAYRLLVGDHAWTPSTLQVRGILDVADDVLITASEHDPAEVHVYRVGVDGVERLSTQPGVHAAARSGSVVVLSSATLDEPRSRVRVFDGDRNIGEVTSHAETPDLALNVELLRLGERKLRSALLLPNGYQEIHGRLPVLVDPYGGPQAQRVLARQQGYLTSQWFADQGFAVLITDGRGMTGRGPEWDRAIAGDLAGPTLDDQVDALHAAAEQHPELDLDRVAIRGWSFGGYLAALGVLRRPDVFHAAIAGAPVCDWRLYDTHYTERYLGLPDESPENYRTSSLLDDASELRRPLLFVHGTVDDNVVLAHTLRLSAALTAAARPHTVLPLPGVSHMPTDELTTENLLLLQVDFLRDSLPRTDIA
ncbi:prolyl oligopeptidase family serine peptidase [Parasphingorhabdus pacifica]